MPHLPTLPIGISSFEIIRENGLLYVDKTRHVFKMADEGRYYFLSRPRRFGKSLTVSTLKCLFQGRRELFEGLWITENTDWEWKEHPVISIDFNQISHDTPESLGAGIRRSLEKIAGEYGVVSDAPLVKERFLELILSLHRKTGMPVVILIDEYDKPIIDHLGKGSDHLEIAKKNRDMLKSFFGVIKGGDVAPVLRFVLLTGVSKFSQVSIFSELNNLKDLTMNEDYADMLGYTQEELETRFRPFIERFMKDRGLTEPDLMESLRRYYNGYRFSEDDVRVYNPFSILNAMDRRKFHNYWFESGTPTFLVNLLRERNYPLTNIEKLELDVQIFSVYDLDHLTPEALLFQTGYITITGLRGELYCFDYPNQEVRISFLKHLLYDWVPADGQTVSLFLNLPKHLLKEDFPAFIDTMTAIFASIPYTLESNRDEAYFHTVFYLMVTASGIDARTEVLTSKGRIDLVMEFAEKVFVLEFKCNQNAGAAVRQIREKRYPDRWKGTGKAVFLMGINFDTEQRNISEWTCEPE